MNSKSMAKVLRTTMAVMAAVGFSNVASAEDQGPAVAAQVSEANSAETVPADGTFISASDKVRESLAKLGLSEGYDPAKETIIVVGESFLASKNPAGDDMFMVKRSSKAMEAYLNAKAEIIRAFSMNFSSADQIATAAEFGENEAEVALAEKADALKAKVAALSRKVEGLSADSLNEELVAKLDELSKTATATVVADAATLAADVTAPVGGAANVVADAAALAADAAAPAAGASATELAALRDEVAAFIKEADEFAKNKEPVNENTSTAKLLSKMPLLGSTVLLQAESWDKTEEIYQMAMAVLWSPKMQENAKFLAMGTPQKAEKKGKFTVKEWLAKQDITAMAGPRRFTDKDGNCIVIGIASRDLAGIPVPKIKAAQMLADTDAIKNIASSLMCDLEAFRETSQNLKEYDDNTSKASEKITDKIKSKTDLQLSGVLRAATKTAIHPINGRKTYTVAYYLDPTLSKNGMEYIKKLYTDSIRVTKATQFKRGQLAGMEAEKEAVEKSTAEFEKGKADAAAEVKGMVRQEEVNAKMTGSEGSAGKNQTTGKGGALEGDNLDVIDID